MKKKSDCEYVNNTLHLGNYQEARLYASFIGILGFIEIWCLQCNEAIKTRELYEKICKN
ncbi:hypothetical protein Glove_326g144 [Diversispora epigaea]|uniref:Uncharacterized protein n=1 Tax=Diversispora epigaea TaxID=1348612 RepID=A0A397HRH9_9GLOM|nr:hypothetical protein Glove_326g144 [Diversispora epigaea]